MVRPGKQELLYAAERVSRVEKSAEFLALWEVVASKREAKAREEAKQKEAWERRLAEEAARKEDARRQRLLREASLEAAYPGFHLSANFGPRGADISIGVDNGPHTSACVRSHEVCACPERRGHQRVAAPLFDWLVKHGRGRKSLFRAALGFWRRRTLTAGGTGTRTGRERGSG